MKIIKVCWWEAMQVNNAELSFIAEAIGRESDYLSDQTKFRLLEPLLQHKSAIVREGAILGLDGCKLKEVLAILEAIVLTDSSSGVRLTAQDALTELISKRRCVK